MLRFFVIFNKCFRNKRDILHLIFVLIFIQLFVSACSISGNTISLNNEMVMPTGSAIEAKNINGNIKIKANSIYSRTYTWDGDSRSAVLKPRDSRWYGSYGAYSPGNGLHWKENNGIMRAVLEEGQQHFNSSEEAIAWLRLPYNENCVYRDDGLVVCFSKNLTRFQLNVNVWQILIGGSEPLIPLESADDRIWYYDPQKKPGIFRNSKVQKYYLGGEKPDNLPGSCNDCILFTDNN